MIELVPIPSNYFTTIQVGKFCDLMISDCFSKLHPFVLALNIELKCGVYNVVVSVISLYAGISFEKYHYFVSEGDGFVEVCANLYGRQGLTVAVQFYTSGGSAQGTFISNGSSTLSTNTYMLEWYRPRTCCFSINSFRFCTAIA